MTSPLQTTMFNGVSQFYNGVATQSLRFDRASDPFLNRTATLGNRKTWTFSTWLKRSGFTSAVQYIFGTNVSNNDATSANIHIASDNTITVAPWANYFVKTNALLRDVGAWYHIVVDFDTTQAGSGNSSRVNIYINGVDQALTNGGATLSQNSDWAINLNQANTRIGDLYGDANELDGYLAETNFVDGLSLDASYFGETKNGVWIPKQPDVSEYGTNGFRLKFDQAGVGTAGTSTIGADTSGKTNHFTSSGIVASDCAMPDSPENNFCTLNPLYYLTASTHLSEGNLQLTHEATAHRANAGTMFSKTGKWYFEVRNKSDTASSSVALGVGLQDITKNLVYSSGNYNYIYYSNNNNPLVTINATEESSLGSFVVGAGDIMQVAYDVDSGKLFIGKNNTYVAADAGTDGNPATGANPTSTLSTSIDYIPFVGTYNNEATANFGQDDTFAGAISSAGNTDGNGIGVFKYAPPSGFLALCTANLPEPTIGPNSGTNEQSDDYFNTVIYSGNGTDDRGITGVGFKPDWVWLRSRANADNNVLNDSSRGGNKQLFSNNVGAEGTATNMLKTFNSDGFTLGTENAVNGSGRTYVSWNWKANGGTKTTNDASSTSVGTIDSVFQANTTSGFSIVTYTGSGSAGTIAHGLGAIPEWYFTKRRSNTGHWQHYHAENTSAPETDSIRFVAEATVDFPYFNDTAPTSTVFSLGDHVNVNASGETYVAYCFAEVEGYSKFGSYSANADADGPFVYTGFRPAWLMIKGANNTQNWVMYDNTRRTINGNDIELYADLAAVEYDSGRDVDFLSNGFKLKTVNYVNLSGGDYIYIAFAEAPFKYANAK